MRDGLDRTQEAPSGRANDKGECSVRPQPSGGDNGAASTFQRAAPETALASPSLSERGEAAAYELKFLVTQEQAEAIRELVNGRLTPDPHADPALGGYRTTSLYFDTPGLDVFRGTVGFRRRKHRLRRYGDGTHVFLERKTKRGDRVRKRRTVIPDGELALLANPLSLVDWPGHWFHRYLLRRGLSPTCRITYDRVALVGLSADGPLRLTFDRQIRGALTAAWDLSAVDAGPVILPDYVIVEFKYRAFLPALFKEIIQAQRLTPSPVSKYRTFLRACGLEGGRGGGDA